MSYLLNLSDIVTKLFEFLPGSNFAGYITKGYVIIEFSDMNQYKTNIAKPHHGENIHTLILSASAYL